MTPRFEAKPQRTLAENQIKRTLEQGTYNAEQIAKDTGYTPQHINRMAKHMKTVITPLPKEAPQEDIGKEKPIEIINVIPPPKLQEIKIEDRKQSQEVIEGFIQAKQIGQLFKSVNQLIPSKYRRPEESMDLLGDMWTHPLNRLLAKYENENFDIMIAGITTIIVFAPVPTEMMRDRKQAQEIANKPREEKPKDEHN